ncbi:hypothetical protein D9M72_481180 [compost metagenome]
MDGDTANMMEHLELRAHTSACKLQPSVVIRNSLDFRHETWVDAAGFLGEIGCDGFLHAANCKRRRAATR